MLVYMSFLIPMYVWIRNTYLPNKLADYNLFNFVLVINKYCFYQDLFRGKINEVFSI